MHTSGNIMCYGTYEVTYLVTCNVGNQYTLATSLKGYPLEQAYM